MSNPRPLQTPPIEMNYKLQVQKVTSIEATEYNDEIQLKVQMTELEFINFVAEYMTKNKKIKNLSYLSEIMGVDFTIKNNKPQQQQPELPKLIADTIIPVQPMAMPNSLDYLKPLNPREVVLKQFKYILSSGNDSDLITEDTVINDDYYLDALDGVELIMNIEKDFNISIPDDYLDGDVLSWSPFLGMTVGQAIDYCLNLIKKVLDNGPKEIGG